MEAQIKALIEERFQQPLNKGIPRELGRGVDMAAALLHAAEESQKIITLIGPRRSGKSTVLAQMLRKLLEIKGVAANHILYMNFEDDRLSEIQAKDLDTILTVFQRVSGLSSLEQCYFFFDEIQNIPGWDKFVRRVYDTISRKIFLTGSNAKLLSREIATSLRGRTISYEVFPFSIQEYTWCKRMEMASNEGISEKTQAGHSEAISFEDSVDFLKFGGFPEVIRTTDQATKIRILQEYFNVMIYRDIAERQGIGQLETLKVFLRQIIASAAKPLSINKIFNTLKSRGVKIAGNTLYAWADACQNAYLIDILERYHTKPLERKLGERKVYLIDPGFLTALEAQDTTTRRFEHMVFLELRRHKEMNDLFFYKDTANKECDFVLFSKESPSKAIQACLTLQDPDTREREINGLIAACREFSLTAGAIVTLTEKETLKKSGVTIQIMPFREWALTWRK